MKNNIKLFSFILFATFAKVLSIVNTEKMSSKLDSTFVLTTCFDGDYTSGNIELTQFNSANQLAFKRIKT
jgi:hypothetical protein